MIRITVQRSLGSHIPATCCATPSRWAFLPTIRRNRGCARSSVPGRADLRGSPTHPLASEKQVSIRSWGPSVRRAHRLVAYREKVIETSAAQDSAAHGRGIAYPAGHHALCRHGQRGGARSEISVEMNWRRRIGERSVKNYACTGSCAWCIGKKPACRTLAARSCRLPSHRDRAPGRYRFLREH